MASCDVKLLVAATPISGPQLRLITASDSCDKDEFRWLTIDNILELDSFAIFTASNTSALSPLCEIAINVEFSSILSGENGYSLEIIGSIFNFAYLENKYFVTLAAL